MDQRKCTEAVQGRQNYGKKTQSQQRTGYRQRTAVPRLDEMLRAEETNKIDCIMVGSIGG